MISMALPVARGGDGKARGNLALTRTGQIVWDKVRPAPKGGSRAPSRAWELEDGFDWSEPQLEPASSRFAGRWASHAIVKGAVKLARTTPPTYNSRIGDLQIYNSIGITFWPQGKYMSLSVKKVTRDLSQPFQEDANAPDGDELPPYSM
jgi:hypothetical protein